jgi:UDP-N-acetylmuramyl pentapeptide phosphotransferase/UDP-N-acetylglucosamine-1-phosphate transferase
LTLTLMSLAVIASGASVLGTRWLEHRLVVAHVLDHPNARSSHTVAVPRGGGLAVAVTVVLAYAGWSAVSRAVDPLVLVSLSAASVLAAVGLVDDLRNLEVGPRLVVQFVTATVAVAAVIELMGSRWLWLPVGVLFVVGTTNVFNFMDGIDGIASATALAAGIVVASAGAIADTPSMMALGIVVAAASSGFLVRNWAPAKIFLGDVGSIFLGGLLSVLAVAGGLAPGTSSLALFGPLLPFLVDGVATLVRRWAGGEPVTQAHRSHLYQRASRRWGHARVAGSYGLAALASGATTLATGLAGDFLREVLGVLAIGLILQAVWFGVGRLVPE